MGEAIRWIFGGDLILNFFTYDKISEQAPIYDPKPSSHDCMDAGGRATQEQLPMDDLMELQGRIYVFSDHKAVIVTQIIAQLPH